MTRPPQLQSDRPSGWRARAAKNKAGQASPADSSAKPPPPLQRRHWKVERLPPDIRDLIFDGYATGKSYRQIREEVLARGYQISENALCKYWRHCWMAEQNDLHRTRTQAEILSRQATGSGSADLAALARDLLWLNFVQRRDELPQADLMKLLTAAREQEKVRIAAHKAGLKATREPPMTPEEMRRRFRQIYGWSEEELDEPESPQPESQVAELAHKLARTTGEHHWGRLLARARAQLESPESPDSEPLNPNSEPQGQ